MSLSSVWITGPVRSGKTTRLIELFDGWSQEINSPVVSAVRTPPEAKTNFPKSLNLQKTTAKILVFAANSDNRMELADRIMDSSSAASEQGKSLNQKSDFWRSASAPARKLAARGRATFIPKQHSFYSTTPLGFFENEVILFWPLLIRSLEEVLSRRDVLSPDERERQVVPTGRGASKDKYDRKKIEIGSAHVAFPLRLRPETEQELATKLWATQIEAGRLSMPGVTQDRIVRRVLDWFQLAAFSGTPTEDIGTILEEGLNIGSWGGNALAQTVVEALLDWREWCLERGLLTYGIISELYWRYLLPDPTYQEHLIRRYPVVLADDVDEYPAIMGRVFDFILDRGGVAAFTYNPDGGIRWGLGADPDYLAELQQRCEIFVIGNVAPPGQGKLDSEWEEESAKESVFSSEALRRQESATMGFGGTIRTKPDMMAMAEVARQMVELAIQPDVAGELTASETGDAQGEVQKNHYEDGKILAKTIEDAKSSENIGLPDFVRSLSTRSRSQLLRETASIIVRDIKSGLVEPEDVVVIAPGLDAIARYTLISILTSAGIPVKPLKDQRPLISFPKIRALLTLLTLVYPGLGRLVDRDMVAEMLVVLSEKSEVSSQNLDRSEVNSENSQFWHQLSDSNGEESTVLGKKEKEADSEESVISADTGNDSSVWGRKKFGIQKVEIDPVRAGMLADGCFCPDIENPRLLSVKAMSRWDRLGYRATNAYEQIFEWIEEQRSQQQQHQLLSPLFLLDRAIQKFFSRGLFLPYEQLAALRELMETATHYWEVDKRLVHSRFDDLRASILNVPQHGGKFSDSVPRPDKFSGSDVADAERQKDVAKTERQREEEKTLPQEAPSAKQQISLQDKAPVGRFIELLRRGVVSANPFPVRSMNLGPGDSDVSGSTFSPQKPKTHRAKGQESAVTLATIFQYRVSRQSHRWQFWLDAGSSLWLSGGAATLLGAPLFLQEQLRTKKRTWTEEDAQASSLERLRRILLDLLSRVDGSVAPVAPSNDGSPDPGNVAGPRGEAERQKSDNSLVTTMSTEQRIYLCHSELAANGQEQTGPLLPLVYASRSAVSEDWPG